MRASVRRRGGAGARAGAWPRTVLCAAAAVLALGAGATLGQQPGRPAKPAPEKAAPERAQPDRGAGRTVVACPSLANYRILTREGAAAGAAVLADPKADHLGCAALPRNRLGETVDRITLGGAAYACAAVQGTTACHWTAAGGDEPAR